MADLKNANSWIVLIEGKPEEVEIPERELVPITAPQRYTREASY